MTATVISLPGRRQRTMPRDAAAASDRALRAELRRARIRIAQLEASLAEALRDNVAHHDRAREAELRLADLLAARELAEPA
jgi:NADP-dependent 3-hydroxy acid dehydrogenase YdfG